MGSIDRKLIPVAIALVALAPVAVAGCGGSDKPESTSGGASLDLTITTPAGITTVTTSESSATGEKPGTGVSSVGKQRPNQSPPAGGGQSIGEAAHSGAPTAKAGPSAASQAAQGTAQTGAAGPSADSLK